MEIDLFIKPLSIIHIDLVLIYILEKRDLDIFAQKIGTWHIYNLKLRNMTPKICSRFQYHTHKHCITLTLILLFAQPISILKQTTV